MQIGKPLRAITVERLESPPLGDKHHRAAFPCGVEALDCHLQKQAGHDGSKCVAAVFVVTPNGATSLRAFQARNEDSKHRSGYTRRTKTAVSIPDDVLKGSERLARKTKRSHSRFTRQRGDNSARGREGKGKVDALTRDSLGLVTAASDANHLGLRARRGFN